MCPDKKKKKKKEEPPKTEETQEMPFLFNINSSADAPKMRVTGIYGDISEEKCSETLYSLLLFRETMFEMTAITNEETDEITEVEVINPIDFYVSTYGGSAVEMFALYDVMRQIREECPIHTIGIGKVMSAGVLLLAAGTPGKRQVGVNCRIMIHGVVSGQHGYLADIENEFEEAKFTQDLYIKALAGETNMTVKYIKKLLQRKTNVYLSAKEAVELGIADIII